MRVQPVSTSADRRESRHRLCHQHPLCEISESTSTRTSPCEITCQRPHQAVTASYASYVIFVAQCQQQSCSRWSLRWCCRHWTTLYGLSGYQVDRLQSVMNDAARLVFSARMYEHVTPLLRDLHWLRVSDRIQFKLSVLVFRCLHGTAPAYLSDELHRVADSGTRRRLRSTSSPALVVRPTRRTTFGDRSFPVTGARVWNALPSFVTDSSTISAFKRHLKTYLFARSLS